VIINMYWRHGGSNLHILIWIQIYVHMQSQIYLYMYGYKYLEYYLDIICEKYDYTKLYGII
jgi:hypothetical protein